MEQRRWLLFIAVTGVIYAVFMIFFFFPQQKKQRAYQEWLAEQRRKEAVTTGTVVSEGVTTDSLRAADVPASPPLIDDTVPTTPTVEAEESEIVIQTDLYRVVLTSRGGRPSSWVYYDRIPDHDGVEPIEMIPQRKDQRDNKQRELPLEVVFKEYDKRSFPQFNTRVHDYTVRAEEDGSTTVVFTSPEVSQLQVVKTYRFRPSSYVTDLAVDLRNVGDKASVRVLGTLRDGEVGLGVSWGPGVREFPADRAGSRGDQWMINPIVGTANGTRHGLPRKEEDVDETAGDIQWAGATDKYFLAAIIPDPERGASAVGARRLVRRGNAYPKDVKKFHSKPFTIEIYSDAFEVAPRQQVSLGYHVFVGPKRPALLNKVDDEIGGVGLNRVLFYRSWWNWTRALKLGLMYSLTFFDRIFGNYGIAILVLTILIRVLMHPVAHKGMKIQAKTMAEMAKIKPELDQINKKYKSDPAKRNQEMMALYKKHGISPLAPLRGCLPMIVQLPIFIALFHLLSESIDLRGASFLWIKDLSAPDALFDLAKRGWDFNIPLLPAVTSINLLPILMGVSQHFMSKMTPTPSAEASQKQMMVMFSVLFPILFYNFPSGLFLYWLINNVWQSVHQLIAKRIVRKPTEGVAEPAKA